MSSSATTKRTTTPSSSSRKTPRKATVKPKALQTVDPSESPLDDAVGYEIDKQINLAQLQDEIGQASGIDNVNLALSSSEDLEDPGASRVVLWVTPAGVDADVITTVVADHTPDPTWGVPQAITDFNAALARLQQNPDGKLTAADRDVLIKGVALNFASLIPKPSG